MFNSYPDVTIINIKSVDDVNMTDLRVLKCSNPHGLSRTG